MAFEYRVCFSVVFPEYLRPLNSLYLNHQLDEHLYVAFNSVVLFSIDSAVHCPRLACFAAKFRLLLRAILNL